MHLDASILSSSAGCGACSGHEQSDDFVEGKAGSAAHAMAQCKGKQGKAAVSRLQIDGGCGIDLRIRAKG